MPVDPALVGMKPGSSTIVGELTEASEPRRFGGVVRVDDQDLFYYDHPVSHVPGIVSCEALRQASLLAACRLHRELSPNETIVRHFDGKFSGYAEPDIDLDIGIELADPIRGELGTIVPADATLTQFGDNLVTAHFDIEFA
jgi:hypothetical protein